MAVNDHRDERVERTNQTIQDTIHKKILKTYISEKSNIRHIVSRHLGEEVVNIPLIDQAAVNAAIHAADTFAPTGVDDAIMRTRAKANSTHAMEVYIPKQEKRAQENEDQPDRKNKVKSQPHEPVFAIEAPPPKPKTKNPEQDHEPKGPRGRPKHIQAIELLSEPNKKQEKPKSKAKPKASPPEERDEPKEKPKEKPKENRRENQKENRRKLKMKQNPMKLRRP